MSTFRSEKMSKYQIFIPSEIAYFSLASIGKIKLVQFCDRQSKCPSQKKFIREIMNCNDIENKIKSMEIEMNKSGISMDRYTKDETTPLPSEIFHVDNIINQLDGELKEIETNAIVLKSNYFELIQFNQVLMKAEQFFTQIDQRILSTSLLTNMVGERSPVTSNDENEIFNFTLGFITGVINRDKLSIFETMLWRICRGNLLMQFAHIEEPFEDPSTGETLIKSAFVIFFQGYELSVRIKKICDTFDAFIFACPKTSIDRQKLSRDVNVRLTELKIVLKKTAEQKYKILATAATVLTQSYIKIHKIKSIYHQLNYFNLDVTKHYLIGECWISQKDVESVKTFITNSEWNDPNAPIILNEIDHNDIPPTYNPTNKFTKAFQNIIDAYGKASYRELNPAVYTIVTFPFFFAIMFGDFGHGFLLTLFALWLIIREKTISSRYQTNQVWKMFIDGRYIVLLMGIFSMYSGLLYNEFFNKALSIFESSWIINATNNDYLMKNDKLVMDPEYMFSGQPYPFGLDPIWSLSTNKLYFTNSIKMKISIIMGIIHMIFGLVLGFINCLYFKQYTSLFCTYVPRLLFMMLFFYLVVLIFVKWFLFGSNQDFKHSPSCAPSILLIFINMMLFKDNNAPSGCNTIMFTGQQTVEKCLIVVVLFSIPWMLFLEPIFLYVPKKFKKYGKKKEGYMLIPLQLGRDHITIDLTNDSNTRDVSTNADDVTELFIHQAIHTMEFVLSGISHTASYLRLWALSLAHAQLSEVLWTMILSNSLSISNNRFIAAVTLTFGFSVFATLTLLLLILMGGLSAFLHTMRLHWIEFQSKFYKASGYPFQPFTLKNQLE